MEGGESRVCRPQRSCSTAGWVQSKKLVPRQQRRRRGEEAKNGGKDQARRRVGEKECGRDCRLSGTAGTEKAQTGYKRGSKSDGGNSKSRVYQAVKGTKKGRKRLTWSKGRHPRCVEEVRSTESGRDGGWGQCREERIIGES